MEIDLEDAYCSKIDCKLNYSNLNELTDLFEEAQSLSPKSVFRFLEELFNYYPNKKQSKIYLINCLRILNKINENFSHPLKEIVFIAGIHKINKELLPTRKAIISMNQAKKYKGNYAVLNIIVFSTRRNRNINMVERLYDSIIDMWKAE